METEESLRKRIDQLEQENKSLRERLARAKNPDPIERPTETRVRRVADNAGIFVERFRSGWMLKFGHRKRWFKKLKDIWLILTSEDWQLSELFPNKVTLIPPIERKVKPRFRPRPWLTPYPKSIQWWHRDTADFLNLWDKTLALQDRANHQGKILSSQQQEVLEHLL